MYVCDEANCYPISSELYCFDYIICPVNLQKPLGEYLSESRVQSLLRVVVENTSKYSVNNLFLTFGEILFIEGIGEYAVQTLLRI